MIENNSQLFVTCLWASEMLHFDVHVECHLLFTDLEIELQL